MSDLNEYNLFSLEDDDYNSLFITQSSNNDTVESMDVVCVEENNDENVQFGINSQDFMSLCVSLVTQKPWYEDISDDDCDWNVRSINENQR